MLEFDKLVITSAYKTTTAANKGFSTRSSSTGYKAEIMISDYRQIMKELVKIDKELLKGLKKNYREIAQPVSEGIKSRISSVPPLSGMRKRVVPGRLTWGTGKPARSTTVRVPRQSKKRNSWAISQIRVNSAATIMSDMAGKSNRFTGKKRITELYRYSLSPTGTRKHRISREGSRMFIANLDARLGGRASRMVYPGAEEKLPQARNQMEQAINEAVDTINRELRRAS